MIASRSQQRVGIVRKVIFGIFASVMAASATAVTVDGLYSTQVPIGGTGSAAISKGYSDGLREVLVRVTGTRNLDQYEGLSDLLGNAESLVQSFQVMRGSNGTGNQLKLSFGPVAVNQAIASVGAPVWGANRPLTLGWIAFEQGGDRALLTAGGSGPSTEQTWRQAFRSASLERGLPITLPPNDLTNERGLLSDIWGQFNERIETESEAIAHDLLGVVKIRSGGAGYSATWWLLGPGTSGDTISVERSSPEALASAIVDAWANRLSSRYALSAGEAGESPRVDVTVDRVSTLSDYAKVSAAFQKLTPVQNVGVDYAEPGKVRFILRFSGELDQLQEFIAEDSRFEAFTPRATQKRPAISEPAAPNTIPVATDSGSDDVSAEAAVGLLSGPVFFEYEPLPAVNVSAVEAQADTEEAFESLYPKLHYHWLPGSMPVGSRSTDLKATEAGDDSRVIEEPLPSGPASF